MKILVTTMIIISSHVTFGGQNPCSSFNRKLSSNESAALTASVTAQLKKEIESIEGISILESYQLKNYQILKVDTKVSDEVYLFYSGNPLRQSYIANWSGTAIGNESKEIEKWVRAHVKGIPGTLVKCFSWKVSKENK